MGSTVEDWFTVRPYLAPHDTKCPTLLFSESKNSVHGGRSWGDQKILRLQGEVADHHTLASG